MTSRDAMIRGWVKRRAAIHARFWDIGERVGECLLWRGKSQTKDKYGSGGYGLVWRNGKEVYAHRHAWELVHGPIPPKMEILHSCDQPLCYEPKHLSLGTHADNMADMARKGRAGRSKFSVEEVLFMSGYLMTEIAAFAGVHPSTISFLLSGKRYSWV